MMNRRTLTLAVVASLGIAGQALAHAHLVRSNPAANATVAAPKTISLTFSEKLTAQFSTFEVAMVGHDMKVPVKTVVSQDGKTITGTPQAAFMPGSYKIIWKVASADGHRMTGEVPFKVG